MSAHQALGRATVILDFLSASAPAAFHISEIAAACELPEASCHRLLQALHDLDWVEQSGRRQPYRLGPRAWAMTHGQTYHPQLVQCLREPAQALAEELNQVVIAATVRGARRQAIAWFHPTHRLSQVHYPRETNDLYHSSGGRLLLALLPRSKRNPIIAELGLPGTIWPGIINDKEFHDALDDLRRDKYCLVRRGNFITHSVAVKVPTALKAVHKSPLVLGTFADFQKSYLNTEVDELEDLIERQRGILAEAADLIARG